MYEDKTFYRIVKPVVSFLFKIVFRPEIKGVENIPKQGRVLVAGNHTSYLDPALLVTASPRQIHFLAKKELWKGITHFIVVGMGAVPEMINVWEYFQKERLIEQTMLLCLLKWGLLKLVTRLILNWYLLLLLVNIKYLKRV